MHNDCMDITIGRITMLHLLFSNKLQTHTEILLVKMFGIGVGCLIKKVIFIKYNNICLFTNHVSFL